MKILVAACLCMSSLVCAMDPRESDEVSLEQVREKITTLEEEVDGLRTQLESSKNNIDALVPGTSSEQKTIQAAVEIAYLLREKIPVFERSKSSLEQIIRRSSEE